MDNLLVLDENIELMPRRNEIDHDWQTISSYPEYVAIECTCGYHAPPVGHAEIPSAHIEYCAFRTNRASNVEKSIYLEMER